MQNPAAGQSSQQKTQLFMVRLWLVPGGQAPAEIRGQVQHVLTGEVQYFGDWATLQGFLVAQLAIVDESPAD